MTSFGAGPSRKFVSTLRAATLSAADAPLVRRVDRLLLGREFQSDT